MNRFSNFTQDEKKTIDYAFRQAIATHEEIAALSKISGAPVPHAITTQAIDANKALKTELHNKEA